MLDFALVGLVAVGFVLPLTVFRARRLVLASWAVGAVLAASVAVWKLSSVRAGALGPTVLRVETDAPLVSLTFDDGPTVAYTNPVLDALDAGDARATFFVVGEALAEHPELGRAIRARGHELGNHSWSHPRLVFAGAGWMRDELARTDAAIRATGQRGPIPFRPPYGKRLLTLHHVLGMRPAILWDIEPESYPAIASDPERLAAHVLAKVRPGSIVLLHAMFESREPTRQALPSILEGLRDRGLRSVPLSELLEARVIRGG